MSLFKAVAILVPIGLGLATVDAQELSTVQEAAQERVKEKLGTIRGTLNKSSKRVYLTNEMIELRRPAGQKPSVSQEALEEEAYLRLLEEAQNGTDVVTDYEAAIALAEQSSKQDFEINITNSVDLAPSPVGEHVEVERTLQKMLPATVQ